MSEEPFRGVLLARPGLLALLAEDGASATVFGPQAPDSQLWTSLLAELHRCGLPIEATVIDEWLDGEMWVTVLG